jgi:hypothetical protein
VRRQLANLKLQRARFKSNKLQVAMVVSQTSPTPDSSAAPIKMTKQAETIRLLRGTGRLFFDSDVVFNILHALDIFGEGSSPAFLRARIDKAAQLGRAFKCFYADAVVFVFGIV